MTPIVTPIVVVAEYFQYRLIGSTRGEGPLETDGPMNAADGIILVSTIRESGPVSVSAHVFSTEPAAVPDTEWDVTGQVRVTCTDPLQVTTWDADPQGEPLTPGAGAWHVRVYMREHGRTHQVPYQVEPPEEHLLHLWPA
ncbi:hypothetical protein [Cellulomonas edaphi]|uniref:Uncharacterized protein n=1 Tax=Cellulomonas edaphi TaxID=3053468 RepID=A0ABT7S5I4_9CELL|nr:hypothetical protein [Cellulomons edaphi]MDM7830876.1 hypothetical protein [Cellulomons edaphi]